jgi:hypothetical protein
MPGLSSSPEGYVYPGVHAQHPGYAAALTGVVVPGDVNGLVTPEQHNLRETVKVGEVAAVFVMLNLSGYWSTSRARL